MLLGWTVVLLLCLSFASGRSHAQNASPSEHQVKAAIIFNFMKFVEWPATAFADTNTPLSVGVLGNTPIGDHLEQATRNKSVNNRRILVKTCRSLEEAKQCHVLFVCDSEKKRLAGIMDELAGASVLTVGEIEGFTKSGGVINFYREGNKFRFEINDEAAKKVKLKISSKLLSLASRPAG